MRTKKFVDSLGVVVQGLTNKSIAICGWVLAVLLLFAPERSHAIIALTGGSYLQDFNTLASSGTSSVMPDAPNGWFFSEAGSAANTLYNTGTGSLNTGDTYSFGSSSSVDRALGGLRSGTLVPTFGVQFINGTGGIITSLAVSYIGEQWRFGGDRVTVDKADHLRFEYSLNGTIWTGVGALDFTSVITTGTAGLRDGNQTANRILISATINSLSLANGSTFWFRWIDVDAGGSDDGLAVDDFSVTPTATVAAVPEPSTFIAGALLLLPFGVRGVRYLQNWKFS